MNFYQNLKANNENIEEAVNHIFHMAKYQSRLIELLSKFAVTDYYGYEEAGTPVPIELPNGDVRIFYISPDGSKLAYTDISYGDWDREEVWKEITLD